MAPDSKSVIGAPPSAGSSIDDRGHAVVGRDREERVAELIALPDPARHDPVRQTGLLEQDRDLLAVRRGPVVQVDHRGLLGAARRRTPGR